MMEQTPRHLRWAKTYHPLHSGQMLHGGGGGQEVKVENKRTIKPSKSLQQDNTRSGLSDTEVEMIDLKLRNILSIQILLLDMCGTRPQKSCSRGEQSIPDHSMSPVPSGLNHPSYNKPTNMPQRLRYAQGLPHEQTRVMTTEQERRLPWPNKIPIPFFLYHILANKKKHIGTAWTSEVPIEIVTFCP